MSSPSRFPCLTGSDYTSAFYKKGKKRPFKIFEESKNCHTAFAEMTLGKVEVNSIREIMSFIARIYGVKANQAHSLNSYCYRVFDRAYAIKARPRNLLEK